MRLPVSKVYRAFPELDRFTDERCEWFVYEACRRHRLGAGAVALGAVVASVGTALVLSAASARFIVRLVPRSWEFSLLWQVTSVVLVGACFLAGAVIGFSIRDQWLRSVVAATIGVAKCPRCAYSLLGLPVRAETVVCPECGRGIALAALGLTAADILAPSSADQPTSAKPSDSP